MEPLTEVFALIVPKAETRLLNELLALGKMCADQGDLKRAEQHFRLAINLYETSFLENHVEAMVCLFGLIDVLRRQGKEEDVQVAEDLIQQLNIRRRSTLVGNY